MATAIVKEILNKLYAELELQKNPEVVTIFMSIYFNYRNLLKMVELQRK